MIEFITNGIVIIMATFLILIFSYIFVRLISLAFFKSKHQIKGEPNGEKKEQTINERRSA